MTTLETANEILVNILKDDIPFALAIRNSFKKNNVPPDKRSVITTLVGCELRHHLLFLEVIKNRLGELEIEHSSYLLLFLADTLFSKRFKKNDFLNLITNQVTPSGIDNEKLNEFLAWVGTTKELIPSKYPMMSNEFLSLRFNCPLWIVRMWSKQYGRTTAIKILKANYRPSSTTCRINTLSVSKEEILTNPNFEETIVSDIVKYIGKTPLKKQKYFENLGLYYEKMATKEILDSLEFDHFKSVGIFASYPNNIYLEISTRTNRTTPIELMCFHSQVYHEARRNVDLFKLDKVNVYDCSSGSSGLVITCLSNKVHTMFVLPKNSSFDLLRSTPDYFLKIKPEQLDSFIQGQLSALKECNPFLEDDGELIYLIPTISKKEGHKVIETFLLDHPHYTLLQEKQYMPFEEMDSCLYFAHLKKREVKDD